MDFMFDHLSNTWLIALGFILCFFVIFIYRKIAIIFTDFFKPFKKGKIYWCKVIAISDGDTLTCRRFNLRRSETKIRFAYIDAPESSQNYGRESQKILIKMVHKKLVRINITDSDRYGRHVAVVYRIYKNVNEEMVKRGAAWVYADYIKDQKRLKYWMQLQDKAKKQKKGLWKSARPIHPSIYRKQNK